MTKNAAGELTVPLSAGQQHVIVQHRQAIAHFPIVFARLQVPRLPVPATYTNVTIRYPDHWIPLWQSFASRGTTWRPETATTIAFLLLALWIERVLAFVNVRARTRVHRRAVSGIRVDGDPDRSLDRRPRMWRGDVLVDRGATPRFRCRAFSESSRRRPCSSLAFVTPCHSDRLPTADQAASQR